MGLLQTCQEANFSAATKQARGWIINVDIAASDNKRDQKSRTKMDADHDLIKIHPCNARWRIITEYTINFLLAKYLQVIREAATRWKKFAPSPQCGEGANKEACYRLSQRKECPVQERLQPWTVQNFHGWSFKKMSHENTGHSSTILHSVYTRQGIMGLC
jgi:hypothetical protein